jgi:hypothetical protein
MAASSALGPLGLLMAGIGVAGVALALRNRLLDTSKPVATVAGKTARILTADRQSPDGCSIVAAIDCGPLGERYGIYTPAGVCGGSQWTLEELRCAKLGDLKYRDLSDLVNVSAVDNQNRPVDAATGIHHPSLKLSPKRYDTLDVARKLTTLDGGEVTVLEVAPFPGEKYNLIVALVRNKNKLMRDGKGSVLADQVVNLYFDNGVLAATVVYNNEANHGIMNPGFLESSDFYSRRDCSNLRYAR